MARISEFEQRDADSIEIAITAEEYANLGTDPGQLRLRLGTFTKDGTEYQSAYAGTNQDDWILDRQSGEYIHTVANHFRNHNRDYQGIVLGSVDANGDAIEIYDAYMIGTFAENFDFSQSADTVTDTDSWVPEGTAFANISQAVAQASTGGDNLPTLRWDWPDNLDDPVVRHDSDLNNTAPCFVRGALIRTPQGAIRVETLKAGDMVMTRDNGFQPLRWIGFSRIAAQDLATDTRRYPIRVRAGALGTDIPARDCYFSRQHRLLVASMDDPDGVLIPVKDLIGQHGIELADDWQGHIDYFHMLIDGHEIVFSDGMQCESLLLTEYSLSLLGEAEKEEIRTIAASRDEMKPARRILQGKTARNHVVATMAAGLQIQDLPALT